MGEIAEAKVIPVLKEKSSAARKAAAQVLEEIGTIKSLQALQRAANDPRDADARVVAQRALEAVKTRVNASRTAQPTTQG